MSKCKNQGRFRSDFNQDISDTDNKYISLWSTLYFHVKLCKNLCEILYKSRNYASWMDDGKNGRIEQQVSNRFRLIEKGSSQSTCCSLG